VVGLGPAGPELLTVATQSAVASIATRFVRTQRHPSAAVLAPARSFDDLYDQAPSFEAVYRDIVEELVAAATIDGEILYAVPGSPTVAERTVELVRADERVDAVILPAVSFVDLAWDRLGVDPLAAGVRLVDGRRFAVEAAGERGPLLVAQCDSAAVLSDVKLALGDAMAGANGTDLEVVVLARLGCPDESVRRVHWAELDRDVVADHLTSVYIEAMAAPVAGEMARFDELVRDLRERCPWDRDQTHQSLTRHLIEEAYEVLEAIGGLPSDEAYEHLQEELGDLLFQVVFHSRLAAEEGRFTLADVALGIHDKLVGRHPHVFAPTSGADGSTSADQVLENWEKIKKAEKGRASVMEGIPPELPALLYAAKVHRKAATLGLDLVDSDAPGGTSARLSEHWGHRLFALAAETRNAGFDPEAALREVTTARRRHVEAFERLVAAQGTDIESLSDQERTLLWAKAAHFPN